VDLRQVELFARIARLGGFRRTAYDLGISQSAVSQQMKLLEAEARVSLSSVHTARCPSPRQASPCWSAPS
jgi:DNA-binding transcriptional LysR family regulator